MLEVQLDYRYCPTCESEQLFEAPLCEDGHGPACPDLACVNCGMAMFVVVISDTATVPADFRRATVSHSIRRPA